VMCACRGGAGERGGVVRGNSRVYEQPVIRFFFNAKSPRSEGAKSVV
jgi:hypothetical protein